MLNCRELAEQADSWLDGELGPVQGLAIRLHMAMCAGCAHFVGQMRRTRDLTLAAARPVTDEAQAAADDRRIAAIYDAFRTGREPDGRGG